MTIRARRYAGLDDLKRMKGLVVEGRKVTPHSGYMHVGDVDWWLFYSGFVKQNDLSQIVHLWEGEDGALLGWLIFDPPTPNFDPDSPSFDMVVHPALRGTAAEIEWIAYAESQLTNGWPEKSSIQTFAWEGDPATCAALEQRGYLGEDFFTYFTRSLADIPAPRLPDGCRFLDRMRPEWVEKRADAHFNAFSPSRMTAEAYRHFMTAPGYDPQLDVTLIAPDGRVAAFAMCWIEPVTRIGSFEPVGTQPDFQRQGMGTAALLEGMRRMRARGMTEATVLTWVEDAGNIAFYQSGGFRQVNVIRKYVKSMNGSKHD